MAGNLAADDAEHSTGDAHRGGGSTSADAHSIGRWLPFIVVALLGIIGAYIAFRVATDADDVRLRGAMELRAEWRARDFERKLRILANPVEAMAILLASQQSVEADEFHRF